MNGNNLYQWQTDIIKLINTVMEEREIYWFIDKIGGIGKTSLCKNLMIALAGDILVSNSLDEKIKDLIYECVKLCDSSPKAILIDRPYIKYNILDYSILEEIKNGCFYSEKCEPEILTYKIPHVIIFSDREPDYSQMRPNKFKVYEIYENKIRDYKRINF